MKKLRMYMMQLLIRTKGVMNIEKRPHHPRNNVTDVYSQNVFEMQPLQKNPLYDLWNIRMSAPMCRWILTLMVGAGCPQH